MKDPFFKWHKKRYRNEIVLYRMRKKLLAVVAFALTVFAAFTLLLFYLSERRVYRDDLKRSNDVMVRQMMAVYELYYRNIKAIAHDAVSTNADLLRLSASERSEAQNKMKILNLLNSVSVMGSQIHSVSLYYEEDKTVYSSLSNPYTITTLDAFGDRVAFEETSALPYQVAPHLVSGTAQASGQGGGQALVFGYVVPVSTRSGGARLCVNINMRTLYSMILRDFELGEGRSFYLVDGEGCIVFHRDLRYLFAHRSALPQEGDVIRSEAYSAQIGYTFVFESTVTAPDSALARFALLITCVMGAILLLTIGAVIYSTVPVRRMEQVAKQAELRRSLTSEDGTADLSFWREALRDSKNQVLAVFRVAQAADVQPFLDRSIRLSVEIERDYEFTVIQMSGELVAIVFGNIRRVSDAQFLQHALLQCGLLCDAAPDDMRVCCAVSGVKAEVEQLREGYRECLEAMQYRYLFPRPVITCGEIDTALPVYPFPVRHERHIINNLMAGRGEACLRHIDEIFADFRSGRYLIRDSEINRYLAVMQENICLRLESAAVPVQHPAQHGFEACATLDEVYGAFVAFVRELLARMEDRPRQPESDAGAAVLDYIEKHFCENDICLNRTSQELSIPFSVVSRVVREATHRSFSEYVTYKRIQRSKELLAEGGMSINAVSEAVGFTYPYYYIRKFKELEGVTPGQYAGMQAPPD